ncbi:MAG: plastocyanin [Natrialbaceae archaeon]|jgi:plastocyanin
MTEQRQYSTRRGYLAALGVGATVGLAGCSESDGAATETAVPEDTVRMVTEKGRFFYFNPVGLFVAPGTTVRFVNASGGHSSTAYPDRIPDGAEPWDSTVLTAEGAVYEHTFEVEGTYDYYCIPHISSGMVARIVVGEPGGPAEGSMPPDGKVPESDRIVENGSVSYDDFTG